MCGVCPHDDDAAGRCIQVFDLEFLTCFRMTLSCNPTLTKFVVSTCSNRSVAIEVTAGNNLQPAIITGES